MNKIKQLWKLNLSHHLSNVNPVTSHSTYFQIRDLTVKMRLTTLISTLLTFTFVSSLLVDKRDVSIILSDISKLSSDVSALSIDITKYTSAYNGTTTAVADYETLLSDIETTTSHVNSGKDNCPSSHETSLRLLSVRQC
jgi:hypothetical protein